LLSSEQIEACGISPSDRAESIGVEGFVKLANLYQETL
jgi:16S rRNA (adenine1518-N6/adenine1519-N6)-dimethyltransferase